MLFSQKKGFPISDAHVAKWDNFLQMLKVCPQTSENFLESLVHFARIISATAASVYLYEEKTNMFLLNKWVGAKPSRLSISGDYEFVTFLKNKDTLTHRHEFANPTLSDDRGAALLYFQHTVSTVVCPLFEQDQWHGILNVDLSQIGEADLLVSEFLVVLYANFLLRWIQHQRILEQNKRFSELNHVKAELLSNVTHELQTPLNGILGLASALLDDGRLLPEHKAQVSLIKNSGDILSKTVNNLLELAQIESKKNQNRREKTNVNDLIVEAASLFSEVCRKKSVQLVLPKNSSPLSVYVHPDQLRTVLINLLGNAVKFTEAGKVCVDLEQKNDWVHVAVSDTGVGIEDEKLNLIFEEFYQADGSHTRVYGGTGLGLALVKKIITLHGGKVWVESHKGAGARFEFTVPSYPV